MKLVCFGLGQGGPVELGKALEWYGAAADCDLSGCSRGDTPRGRHGDLAALFVNIESLWVLKMMSKSTL